MAFAKFMAGWTGRIIRIVAGIVIIVVALTMIADPTLSIIVAIIGVLPILAGVFNFCLVAPLIGAPFSGRQALDS